MSEWERKTRKFIWLWSIQAVFALFMIGFVVWWGFLWALVVWIPLLGFDVWRLIYSVERLKEVREFEDDQAYANMLIDLVEWKRQNP